MLIDAHKGFLGEVFGVLFVLKLADEITEKLFGMTLHEGVERVVMTFSQTFHVGPVQVVRVRHGAGCWLCIP